MELFNVSHRICSFSLTRLLLNVKIYFINSIVLRIHSSRASPVRMWPDPIIIISNRHNIFIFNGDLHQVFDILRVYNFDNFEIFRGKSYVNCKVVIICVLVFDPTDCYERKSVLNLVEIGTGIGVDMNGLF